MHLIYTQTVYINDELRSTSSDLSGLSLAAVGELSGPPFDVQGSESGAVAGFLEPAAGTGSKLIPVIVHQ
jgi:hypothetical protein